jgi:FAD/FMN-containing dehydrogenase
MAQDDVPIDRRTVLRWLGVGAAATVAGCSSGSSGHGAAPSTSSRVRSGLLPATATTTHPHGPVPWANLSHNLTGRLVRPSTPTYGADLRSYDPRFDISRPAAIAFCAKPSDVQHCIDFARNNDVPFVARSGGHSYAGYSTTTGLVIDVTAMNGVSVNGQHASIGAGARLIDIYTSLNNRGVSIPGGSCPTVGIAGLALGGGIGVVARKHGMTCDAMTKAQVVTADSRVVTADASHYEDLYWACRGGGGGNFGIATSFEFATFPTADVALFTLRWPWPAVSAVLAAWMSWIADAPDPLWSNCILAAGSSTSTLSVGGIWLGPDSQVTPYINQLVANVGSAPSSRFVETVPFEHAMYVEAGCSDLDQAACHVVGQTPQAQLGRGASFAGSEFIAQPLSHAGITAVLAGIDERTAARRPGTIAFDSYGGAINRVPPTATAFVHRSALCCAQYSVNYNTTDSPAVVAGHRAWLAQYRTAMQPYVSGAAYQNYIDPTLPNALHAYYGQNLPRLKTVKKKLDPDDLFRFPQSIPLP